MIVNIFIVDSFLPYPAKTLRLPLILRYVKYFFKAFFARVTA